ncbi:MAG: cytochrome c [Bacteroidetes bacterium]|nr:cytochrome c [Bacteroidota bacterium]
MKLLYSLLFILIISGCAVKDNTQGTAANQYSGLKLWEQNCARCHNSPSPASFSDAEWDVIGAHMRVRAYLIGKESDEIIKFLKTIN